MVNKDVIYKLVENFDEDFLCAKVWNDLLSHGNSDVIFMTWHWQKTWWEVFGRGRLLLLMAVENDHPVTIAPLFADGGMLFFVGSGGSDYLDFIGTANPEIIYGLLSLAIEKTPGISGFHFYHIHFSSATQQMLFAVAAKMGWDCFEEGSMACPILSIKDFPEEAKAATEKKSLLRHERWFNKNGGIRIQHYSHSKDISKQMEPFFNQHIERWSVTPYPSLFLDPLQRTFLHSFQ